MRRFLDLLRRDAAQDLIEYTLLLAAVALVGAGLLLSSGYSVGDIWGSTDDLLTLASDNASGMASPSSSGGASSSTGGNSGGSGGSGGHHHHGWW